MSETNVICDLCKVEVKKGPECIKCKRSYHNCCAIKVVGLRVVKEGVILCCENATTDLTSNLINQKDVVDLINSIKHETTTAISLLQVEMENKLEKLTKLCDNICENQTSKNVPCATDTLGASSSNDSSSTATGVIGEETGETTAALNVEKVNNYKVLNPNNDAIKQCKTGLSILQVNQAVNIALRYLIHKKRKRENTAAGTPETPPEPSGTPKKARLYFAQSKSSETQEAGPPGDQPAASKTAPLYFIRCANNVTQDRINAYLKYKYFETGDLEVKYLGSTSLSIKTLLAALSKIARYNPCSELVDSLSFLDAGTDGSEGFTAMQKEVHTIVQAVDDHLTGVSRKEICSKFAPHQRGEIIETIQFLIDEGYIYSTISPDYFKATSSID